MKNNTTLNKLIKERPSQLVLDIREAIIEEYNEHETCGYDIGCIVTSKTLTDKLDKILSQSIQSGYEQGIKDVEQKILDKLLYIGNEIPSGVAEDKRDKFVLLGYPSEFLGKLQSLTQKEKL